MHRLFNDRAKPYVLIDVKTNSEESSCAKKLFLYEFSLSMLSNMNYIHIHSDMIKIFALLCDEALMRWPHDGDDHLLINHIIIQDLM